MLLASGYCNDSWLLKSLSLKFFLLQGKPIRMMGVFDDEIEEVSDNGKRPDLRIIGFDEEEQRLRAVPTWTLPWSLSILMVLYL